MRGLSKKMFCVGGQLGRLGRNETRQVEKVTISFMGDNA